MSTTLSTSALPLARRYRPAAFTGPRGLVGQRAVVQTLTNSVRSGRIANAYLLAGPRGTGKTTSARVLAAALNCEVRRAARKDMGALPADADINPCGECETCRRILGGSESPDVVEIDAATNRGADDARALRQSAQFAPTTDNGYKVYIVDEAHMLTREAWNALLKVLEEPPPRVCFVFCTTDPKKIESAAEPIMSRCQRLDCTRVSVADITRHLMAVAKDAGINIESQALPLIAKRADGGLRDALSLLDQVTAFAGEDGEVTSRQVRDALGMLPESMYLGVLEVVVTGGRERVLKLVDHLEKNGADLGRFLADWQETLRSVARIIVGDKPEGWSKEGEARLSSLVKESNGALSLVTIASLSRLAQQDGLLLRQVPDGSHVIASHLQEAITIVAGTADGQR